MSNWWECDNYGLSPAQIKLTPEQEIAQLRELESKMQYGNEILDIYCMYWQTTNKLIPPMLLTQAEEEARKMLAMKGLYQPRRVRNLRDRNRR